MKIIKTKDVSNFVSCYERIRSYFMEKSTLLLVLIAGIISCFMAYIRVNSGYAFMGDTGQLYILLENVHNDKGFYNQIMPSLNDFSFKQHLGSMPYSEICNLNLDKLDYNASEYDHLRFHAYLILYPISLLLYLFDAPYVANGLNIFSFIIFLVVAYKISRDSMPILMSALIIGLITLHPAWSWSIVGQPYVDRFYLPFGLLLFYFFDRSKSFKYSIVVMVIISGLIVEKAIIYSGIFMVTYSIINYKTTDKISNTVWRLLFGLFTIIVFSVVNKYFIKNIYYTTAITFNPNAIFSLFKDQRFLNGACSLIFVCLPFLLPALLYKPRIFLVAVVMLIPNIVGNIGGAEKTGFYTHYHTLYFPFLVYAFIVGISAFNSSVKCRVKWLIILVYFSGTALFYLHLSFDPSQRIALSGSPSQSYFLNNFLQYNGNKENYKHITNIVETNLPIDSKISAMEFGWPYLYKYNNISMYPYNIDNSDYIWIGYSKVGNKYEYYGYMGYLGAINDQKVDDCLLTRIKKAGYLVDNPIIINSNQALLKKI